MRNGIPGVGFLDAYLRTLTFQSLYCGFADRCCQSRLLNLSKGFRWVVSVRKYARRFLRRENVSVLTTMERKHSDSDIQHSQIKIIELRRVGGDPIKPEYAGKMETPNGVLEFVTWLDDLENGEVYEAVYDFTENWMGEVVAQIRKKDDILR